VPGPGTYHPSSHATVKGGSMGGSVWPLELLEKERGKVPGPSAYNLRKEEGKFNQSRKSKWSTAPKHSNAELIWA